MNFFFPLQVIDFDLLFSLVIPKSTTACFLSLALYQVRTRYLLNKSPSPRTTSCIYFPNQYPPDGLQYWWLTTGHSSFLEQLPSTGTPQVPSHSTARRPRNWKNRDPYLKAETKMLSHTTAWLQVRATPWCLISSRRSKHWKRASVSSLSSPVPLSFNSVCLLEYFLTITDWTMGLCWSFSHPK